MVSSFKLKLKDYIYYPEGKLIYNKAMFEEVAGRYDFITRVLSFGRDSIWKDELVLVLPEFENIKCLDMGCGTGDITFRLAKKYPEGEVIGIDVTEAMLDKARQRNNFNNVSLELKDMCYSRYGDNSFDIITGGYALRNAGDIKRAIKEVWRLLRPGGVGAFLDFSKSRNKFEQKMKYFILKLWTSFWGIIFHGKAELYGYIAESLEQFPDSEELKFYFKEAGFINIISKKYYFGIMETIWFEKPGGQNH